MTRLTGKGRKRTTCRKVYISLHFITGYMAVIAASAIAAGNQSQCS